MAAARIHRHGDAAGIVAACGTQHDAAAVVHRVQQLPHRALQLQPQIGTLLPCNVIVRDDDAGRTIVDGHGPGGGVLGLVDSDAVTPIAADVRRRLERVLAAV